MLLVTVMRIHTIMPPTPFKKKMVFIPLYTSVAINIRISKTGLSYRLQIWQCLEVSGQATLTVKVRLMASDGLVSRKHSNWVILLLSFTWFPLVLIWHTHLLLCFSSERSIRRQQYLWSAEQRDAAPSNPHRVCFGGDALLTVNYYIKIVFMAEWKYFPLPIEWVIF